MRLSMYLSYVASRRKPVVVQTFMQQPQVEAMFQYYEDALLEIYRFYSASSDTKSRNMVQSLGKSVRTFDDHRTNSNDREEKGKGTQMSYADFLRFSGDFGLTSSLALTALDLGDIYLTVISNQNFTATVRSLTFKEFWEVSFSVYVISVLFLFYFVCINCSICRL